MALMIYFMIGSIVAVVCISDADEMYKKGFIDLDEYLLMKYKKPFIFSIITLFWLPNVLMELMEMKVKK